MSSMDRKRIYNALIHVQQASLVSMFAYPAVMKELRRLGYKDVAEWFDGRPDGANLLSRWVFTRRVRS